MEYDEIIRRHGVKQEDMPKLCEALGWQWIMSGGMAHRILQRYPNNHPVVLAFNEITEKDKKEIAS